jgi:hypothetical protein
MSMRNKVGKWTCAIMLGIVTFSGPVSTAGATEPGNTAVTAQRNDNNDDAGSNGGYGLWGLLGLLGLLGLVPRPGRRPKVSVIRPEEPASPPLNTYPPAEPTRNPPGVDRS